MSAWVSVWLLFLQLAAPADTLIPLDTAQLAPRQLTAEDVPNDDGSALRIQWEAPALRDPNHPLKGYLLYRKAVGEENWVQVDELGPSDLSYKDTDLKAGRAYLYRVVAVYPQLTAATELREPVRPIRQWLHRGRLSALVIFLLYSAIFFAYLQLAERDATLFIRKIPGLEAIDEAVGRSTEMGRPILYTFGMGVMTDLAVIASLAILKRVARKVAEYETDLIIPNSDPVVMSAAQEVVKEAYLEAGRPDLYDENKIFFLTSDQFGYTAGVDGIIMRERPGAIFLQGYFFAESLILAETGFSVGAIQIAGTNAVTQLPFFIAACDYTLIGEEMFAASAYLTRQPTEVASIKAEDMGKLLIAITILAGVLLETLGIHWMSKLFTLY